MKIAEDENSKQRILDSATKLFARRGFDGVSIREICKDANINICMISYYFGGKKELHEAIIQNLIEQQTRYAKSFIDFNLNTKELSKKEQVDLLFLILDKFVDFFYENISKDLILFLIKEQQSETFIKTPPALKFLRKLIADIFNKDENDSYIIFKTLFIISQINCARIFPAFSLNLLKQDDFSPSDIKIIKDNVKFYIRASLEEDNIV